MKTFNKSVYIILLLLFTVAHLNAQVNKEGTFKVSKGDLLSVSIKHGNIKIETNQGTEIKVNAKNIDAGEVDLFTMGQSKGKVEIRFDGEDSEDFELNLVVPSALNTELNTGGGNIVVNGNLDGKVNISTGGGNVKLLQVNGLTNVSSGGGNISTGDINGDIEVSTGGGEISVGTVNGTANLGSGGGNINVKSIKSSAEISTAGGNISVGSVDGKAEISSGGGNIYVKNVIGAAEISTGGGNIDVDGADGKVEVNTGGGNINLKNIKGSVDANTASGNLTVYLQPDGKSKSELNTGMGTLTLYVPESAKVTIIANTKVMMWSENNNDLENIVSDFEPVTINRKGEPKQIVVTYVLNGGGSNIELSSGMGKIKILKK